MSDQTKSITQMYAEQHEWNIRVNAELTESVSRLQAELEKVQEENRSLREKFQRAGEIAVEEVAAHYSDRAKLEEESRRLTSQLQQAQSRIEELKGGAEARRIADMKLMYELAQQRERVEQLTTALRDARMTIQRLKGKGFQVKLAACYRRIEAVLASKVSISFEIGTPWNWLGFRVGIMNQSLLLFVVKRPLGLHLIVANHVFIGGGPQCH